MNIAERGTRCALVMYSMQFTSTFQNFTLQNFYLEYKLLNKLPLKHPPSRSTRRPAQACLRFQSMLHYCHLISDDPSHTSSEDSFVGARESSRAV